MSEATTDSEPSIEHRRDQPYLGIPIQATLAEWEEVNALLGELLEWMGRNGESPAGAPFYQYHVMGDETTPFEVEVCVPTEERLSGDDRVTPGTVPSGTYAVTIHEGHPDELDRSHAALQEWTSPWSTGTTIHPATARLRRSPSASTSTNPP